MYKQGDVIVYRGSGVCVVDDICEIRFGHGRPQKNYILKPMFVAQQGLTISVPCDNEMLVAKMQDVMTKKEAQSLLKTINEPSIEWIEERNARKDKYGDIILNGERRDIVSVIALITQHKESLSEDGKSLNMQDEKLLLEAERRMRGEFAVALGVGYEEVHDLIMSKVNA